MAQPLPINREVERMCSYLASLSYTVTRDWLTGCVEYFRDENSHYSVSDLQEFVRKQWELSDLRDSSGGSLPPNLQNQMKITLRGKYAVQIESVLNISEPAYSQMQKIRKVDIGNVEVTEKKQESWEPRAGRMLKLKMCDGQRQAEAIEYRPLRMLNEHILPGTKILIIGPVDCRRGVFFLKPENVKLIGGEVDSLLIVNHMENILARALGLPENQDPFSNVSEASATQLSATAVSDSQRSTYTPSVAATPGAPHGPSGRQLNSDVSERRMTQQRIQDMFRNRPTRETSEDALNTSLDGTGWTVDDLLAEGDDAFLALAEERTVVAVSSSSASTTTRLANDVPTKYCPGQSRQNASSTAGGNSVFKVPQVPANKSKQSGNQKAVSNSSNLFLADDAYIDAFDVEWEDEEMNEFVNISSEFASNSSSSKTPSVVKNASKNEPSTSKIANTSSFKWPQMPPNNMQCKQLNAGRSCRDPEQSSGPRNCGSAMRPSTINQEMKEASGNQVSPTNMQSSRISTGSSSKNSNAKVQFSSEYSNPVQGKESLKKMIFNKSTPKDFADKEQMPKTFDQQPSKDKNFSSPPDVFGDDEDWADAYLSSHNSSFVNKFDDLDKLSSPKSLSNHMDFPPRGATSALKRPSLLVDDTKSTKKGTCEGPSKSNVSDQSSNFVGDRKAFLESRSHLRPAISSPSSCLNSETEIPPKAPAALSTSSCSSLNSKPSTSSSSSSPSTVILPASTNLDSVTSPKSSSLMSPEPYEHLVHILKSPSKTSGTHRIKATIMTLLSQLKVEAGHGWSLSVKLRDGTATLDARFSPLVLDEIIGMSAQEFKKMKRDIPNNPLLKEKLVKKLEKTRDILMNLNCFFDIKFEAGQMAQIIQISEITAQEVNKSKLRLKES
ncbi:hypothetical protein R5R35_008199 [Gryllus longicercus]|uniref:RecQ-mediated genome instability protein 1 n=1 Tax=Gryllus longicercus TaxID=2509291 RepID=A0AAN9ZB73_9ORTH